MNFFYYDLNKMNFHNIKSWITIFLFYNLFRKKKKRKKKTGKKIAAKSSEDNVDLDEVEESVRYSIADTDLNQMAWIINTKLIYACFSK